MKRFMALAILLLLMAASCIYVQQPATQQPV